MPLTSISQDPATFTHHDFTAGGRAGYFRALPDNQKWQGAWKFTAVVPIVLAN